MIIVFFILPLFACVFVDLYFSIFTFCWTTWCNLWLINANVEHKDDPIQFRPLNFQLWIKSYHNAKIIFILKCKKCFWPKSCFPHLQAAAKLNPSEEINLFKKTNYLKVATLVWKLQLSWKKFFKKPASVLLHLPMHCLWHRQNFIGPSPGIFLVFRTKITLFTTD